MESTKKFLRDDSGTAEGTTVLILIAAAGILLAAGVGIYYSGIRDFFNTAGAVVDGYAAKVPK